MQWHYGGVFTAMGQPLRIECSEKIFFITTRTVESRLWFVNDKIIERLVLAYLAKYQKMYGVAIYAFCLMGNHYHLIAKFPNKNKAKFMRSFNAIFAKVVKEKVPNFQGKLWARRYADQVLPNNEDVEHWYHYCALNAVFAGLSKTSSGYPSYNSFNDSLTKRIRRYKLFHRSEYNEAKRFRSNVIKEEFVNEYELIFSALPGYEKLSNIEYEKIIRLNNEAERNEAIETRLKSGKKFGSLTHLNMTRQGSKPKNTKQSDRYSFRPLVLTLCKKTKTQFLNWYFDLLNLYKEVSSLYLKGHQNLIFPTGTYKPPLLCA